LNSEPASGVLSQSGEFNQMFPKYGKNGGSLATEVADASPWFQRWRERAASDALFPAAAPRATDGTGGIQRAFAGSRGPVTV
jgi:hypothetical protein